MINKISVLGSDSFENLKQINEHNQEYWSARDLQPLLGYSRWQRFENALQKAMKSCEESGNKQQNHFASVGKMVAIGSGVERETNDFHLSRFACYLIAQKRQFLSYQRRLVSRLFITFWMPAYAGMTIKQTFSTTR